jgi:hypothetical protein
MFTDSRTRGRRDAMTTGNNAPFDPDAITAVMRHMNDDHASDNLVIVQAHGVPDATAARMSGMTPDAIEFTADVGERSTLVAVPWPMPIATRADVRTAVVQVFHDACARLGRAVEPGTH